jgi:glycosyltransferase involved in cell wall biosynthesis
MRIGLVIYGSLDTISGGYLYDRKLVEYLRHQGEQVEIISLPWRNYLHHLADNLSPSVYRRIQQARVDILLQDELNHPSLFWLNRRLKAAQSHSIAHKQSLSQDHPLKNPSPENTPIISIVHHLRASENHPAWQLTLYRRVERLYLSSLDGFIFNSQTTRNTVSALMDDIRPSVIAYPAGDHIQADISEVEILQRARQEGPLQLIFVGNLIPRKGFHTLISAMSQLPLDAVTLTVVGSPQPDRLYAAEIQRLVAQSGLAAKVKFLGHQNDSELSALLYSHHVIVVPSSYEGFGIVYLEGMAFGLPAIGTTAGAAAEIITAGVDGFLVDPDDAVELSRVLTMLHQDRQRLAQMSLAARQRFLAHPTWGQTGAIIHGFLKNMFARRPLEAR